MSTVYIILDLLLLCCFAFLIYKFVCKFRQKERKVVRPNMEVFHDPCLRQNTLSESEYDNSNFMEVNGFGYLKYDDGNNLMRKQIKNRGKVRANTDINCLKEDQIVK